MKARALLVLIPAALLLGCAPDQSGPVAPLANTPVQFTRNPPIGRGHGALGVVYVSSQGLYYDTFVAVQSLPMEGRFQLLDNGVTEFGPGEPGYLAGRWWEDVNGDGIQDSGDNFLLCPLLPPGRPTP